MEKQKVIIYVDGFNFYYGLKKNRQWRRYYWLDVIKFFEKFMKPDQELVCVKYFSARPNNTDIAIVVSADSDMIPAIELALQTGTKVFVFFPPFHHSNSLCSISTSRVINLERYESRFRQCLLPDIVHIKESDFDLTIPEKWKSYQNERDNGK